MTALHKGAGAQEGRPLNLCLETGSLFPLPLPRAGPAWKQPLEMGPREPGRGAGLAAAPVRSTSPPPPPPRLGPSPSWGQAREGESFLSRSIPVSLPPCHTRPAWHLSNCSSPGQAGGCGQVSTLSFPKRPWGLGRGQSYSLGLLQGRALGSLPGWGPHSSLCPR